MDKRFIGKTCPFCKTPFRDNDVIVTCSTCEMPHHLSCWQDNKGCTTFGCTGSIKETFGTISPSEEAATTSKPITKKELSFNEDPHRRENSGKRYETLCETEPMTIQEGFPVLTEKIAIIIDNQDRSLMARCTFRSLADKSIMAMLINIRCFDVWGQETKPVEGFQLLDLKTKRDSTFGQTTPIPIPDVASRNLEIVIKKILFSDRTMVDGAGDIFELPKQLALIDYFGNAELAEQFVRDTNDLAKYNVVLGAKYWRCTCGAINETGVDCYRCKANCQQLIDLQDKEATAKRLAGFNEQKRLKAEREKAEREEQIRQAEERMRLEKEEKERQEREEAERAAEELRQKKEKKKKAVKKTFISIFSVLFAAFLVYATGWHVIPYVKYTKACEALAAQSFDDAYAGFVELGDFSDCQDKATDTLYQKGTTLMKEGSFAEAAEEFKKIPDYLDSKEQATYCSNEAAYRKAKDLFAQEKYKEAAEGFASIKGYSDSDKLAEQSNYLYANELLESEKYADAYSVFKALGKYSDAADLAKEAEYLYGIERFDAGDYENAVAAFKIVKDYKDVADRMPEAKYLYAVELAAKSDWKASSALFKELGNYKDSATQFEETRYQYGLQMLSEKSYKDAATAFSELGNYQESKIKLNEAMYAYVLGHKNSTDRTTYNYLKELKSSGYKDSKEMYNKLYAWTVKMIINDSETNDTTSKSSISKYKTVYCHVMLQGGPPGEGINVKYSYTWPNGSGSSGSWDGKWYEGYGGTFWTWYTTPAYGSTGTFKARIYNKDTGELIGESTVSITN